MEKKMTSIGGQAIIEGVMMRGPKKIAMAVRKPDGEIVIEEKEVKGIGKWAKVPIVRGVVSFISSMVIGIQALMFSAQFFEDEETQNKSEDTKKEKTESNSGLPDGVMYGTLLVSLLFSIGLFMLLPNFIAGLIVPMEKTALYNVVENIVKITIFIGYLAAVSQMKDIKRVFEYHGAEHKSIFCYENGEELTVENVKKYQRFHPRCGTSFLLFVIIISIIFFSFLPRYSNVFINMLIRLVLMPVVAGVSYEIIKFAGRSKNKCVMLLNKPGMWLQRLTTREPDDSQIEVAIRSLKAVIPENGDDDKW
ncbi:MAG: DUF1385 domain-containing protein [Clostridia bacterium]|nr:DUF1385 domain-containing protein [Clostridia bacterium]